MTNLRHSVYWSAFSRYAGFALQFASTVVLARLLTPEEIGIFSVSMAFVVVLQALREFGVANFLIQSPSLDDATLRRAQGVAFAMAWSLAALVFLGRDAVAAFYGEPAVAEVMRVQAVAFLLAPVGLVARATLVRAMRFDLLCAVELPMAAAQAGVSVAAAVLGAGYMSMAWGQLAHQVAAVCLLAALRPRLVFLPPRLGGWMPILGFGSFTSAAAFLAQAGVYLPEMIIGRLIGFGAVGFYTRATGLAALYNRGIESVAMPLALPAFANARHAGDNVAGYFLAALALLTGFAWPFFATLGVLADPLVPLLFGETWRPAVPVLQILCVALPATAFTGLAAQAMVAFGAVRRNFARLAAVQAVNVGVTLATAPHGLEAVAAGQIVTGLFNVALSLLLLRGLFRLRTTELARAAAGSLRVAGTTATAAALTQWLAALAALSPALSLPLGLSAAAAGWAAGVLAFGHPIAAHLPLRRRTKPRPQGKRQYQ